MCTGQEQDKSLGVSGKCTFARNIQLRDLRAKLPRLLKRIMTKEDEDDAKVEGEQE